MILSTIIRNEWRNLFRTGISGLLWGMLAILAVFTIWQAAAKTRDVQEKLQASQSYMRDKFTGQGEVNPHNAVHYGHYVFKPLNTLSVLDNGVNDYTGVSLYLEGHRQNEATFAPAQGSSSITRFGQLSLSLVLQILLPLFIIFTCHNAITKEREGQTLSLTVLQAVSMRRLVWGKVLAYTVLWTAFLTICLGILWLFTNGGAAPVSPVRLGGLWLLYTSYYFIVTAVCVLVSSVSKSSGNALLALLFGWLLCTVLLPKITANVGENAAPLLTRIELEERISTDKKNGIDGHNPSSERTQLFRDSLIKTYQVSSLDSLPVNLDGLLMQADEEYNNVVFDKHYGTIQQSIEQQRNATSISSWVNPFAFVRNLSMAMAGTDVYHHFDFTDKAEDYRRTIIKKMNDIQAYGGSKTGDWDWRVPADFWNKIDDFNYTTPAASFALQHNKMELAALAAWLLLVILLIQTGTNKLPVIK